MTEQMPKVNEPLKVSSFKDLMSGYEQAQIKCLLGGDVVRTLTVKRIGSELHEVVEIDARDGSSVTVPIDTEITYEPWAFDRGNLLFKPDGATIASKICTEYDVVVYPDGTEYGIEPDDGDGAKDKAVRVKPADLDMDDLRAEAHMGPDHVCRPRFESETHALALEGLIDGNPCDDLGRVLRPIVDFLRNVNAD